jgi:hypothetical protein
MRSSVAETIRRADEALAQARRQREANRQAEERRTERIYADRHQRQVEAALEAPLPSVGEALGPSEQAYRAAREEIQSNPDLTPEARARRLKELAERQQEVRCEVLTEVFGAFEQRINALKPLARTDDDPKDEARYARVEREVLAELATRKPTPEGYAEIVADGDPDRIRAYEIHALRHVEGSSARETMSLRQALSDAIEEGRASRLTDTQRRATARLGELEAERDRAASGLALRGMLPGGIPGISDTLPAYSRPRAGEGGAGG